MFCISYFMSENINKLIVNLENYLIEKKENIKLKSEEGTKELEVVELKLGILKKYIDNPPKSKDEMLELSKLLCFGNLGYCCKKFCPWRNAVLEICDISENVFEAVKEKIGFELMCHDSEMIVIGSKSEIKEEDVVAANKAISSI